MSYTKEQFNHQEMTMAEIEEFAKKLESGELDWKEPSPKTPHPGMPCHVVPIERGKIDEAEETHPGIDPTDLNAVKKHGYPLTRKQRRAIERKLNKKLKRK